MVSQIYGHFFEPGVTVTVGGVPAASVNYIGSTRLEATMPAVPPGSVNDIVVTNTPGRLERDAAERLDRGVSRQQP